MRNILMTVLMLVVVVVLFVSVINSDNGVKKQIEVQGEHANTTIKDALNITP